MAEKTKDSNGLKMQMGRDAARRDVFFVSLSRVSDYETQNEQNMKLNPISNRYSVRRITLLTWKERRTNFHVKNETRILGAFKSLRLLSIVRFVEGQFL